MLRGEPKPSGLQGSITCRICRNYLRADLTNKGQMVVSDISFTVCKKLWADETNRSLKSVEYPCWKQRLVSKASVGSGGGGARLKGKLHPGDPSFSHRT